ncbi:MAG: LuxR family transcriptional regulator [Desulfobacterales bacterium]|nr:LuxR family transcriptional regulator [Desulfobacterales bacterium]
MKTKPKIEIDINRVEELASNGLSQEQIASMLGVCEKTLYTRKKESTEFTAAIKRGRSKGISTIANKLFEDAKNGNTTAQIFFLKTQGEWRECVKLDKVDVNLGGEIKIAWQK